MMRPASSRSPSLRRRLKISWSMLRSSARQGRRRATSHSRSRVTGSPRASTSSWSAANSAAVIASALSPASVTMRRCRSTRQGPTCTGWTCGSGGGGGASLAAAARAWDRRCTARIRATISRSCGGLAM
jgi:hypothetical protein